MSPSDSFHSIYSHGFLRVAACVPRVRVADPAFNAEHTVDLARRAAEQGAAGGLFPRRGGSAFPGVGLFPPDAPLDAGPAAGALVTAAAGTTAPARIAGGCGAS